jgi:hypothetical protein
MKIQEAATEQKTECCGQCPFARSTSKKYLDTRGDNAERFIGQAFINAILPCHMDSDNNNATVGEGRQCAGAAKFRANCKIDYLHKSIGTLPPDKETVFGKPAGLLAHHRGISVGSAELYLENAVTPMEMATEELSKAILKGAVCHE